MPVTTPFLQEMENKAIKDSSPMTLKAFISIFLVNGLTVKIGLTLHPAIIFNKIGRYQDQEAPYKVYDGQIHAADLCDNDHSRYQHPPAHEFREHQTLRLVLDIKGDSQYPQGCEYKKAGAEIGRKHFQIGAIGHVHGIEQAAQTEKYPSAQPKLHKGGQPMKKDQEFLCCLHIIYFDCVVSGKPR